MDAPPPLQDMRSLWAPPYLVSCRYPDKSVAGAIACFIQLFLFYLFTCLSFLSLICMDVYHLADEVFFSLVWNNHVARNSHVYLGRRHAPMMRAVAIACWCSTAQWYTTLHTKDSSYSINSSSVYSNRKSSSTDCCILMRWWACYVHKQLVSSISS